MLGDKRQRRRPGADAGSAPTVWRARVKQLNLAVKNVIDRVALQASDFNRPLPLLDHHARALAQNLRGAHATATLPENVRFKNNSGRAADVPRHDALDE